MQFTRYTLNVKVYPLHLYIYTSISIAWDIDVKSMFFTMCLRSLVVRALERYSKDPGSSPGGDTCFSLQ